MLGWSWAPPGIPHISRLTSSFLLAISLETEFLLSFAVTISELSLIDWLDHVFVPGRDEGFGYLQATVTEGTEG